MTTPDLCYAAHPSDGSIIIVKRGEVGYWPAPGRTAAFADRANEHMGVSPAMREAMQTGSCFGWDVPGATDLSLYADAKPLATPAAAAPPVSPP